MKTYGCLFSFSNTKQKNSLPPVFPSVNMRQNMLFYTKLCGHLGYRKLCFVKDPTVTTDSCYNESTTMSSGVFMRVALRFDRYVWLVVTDYSEDKNKTLDKAVSRH